MSPAVVDRLRLPVLALAAAATVWFGVHAAGVGIEHDNESLRSADVAELALLADFRRAFGSDEDILVAVGHPRLLAPDGLALLRDLTGRIAALDGVRAVYSLANAEELVTGEAGAEPRPLLEPALEAPGMEDRVRSALDRAPELTGLLVSADRRAAGLLVELEDRPGDNDYRKRLVEALRALGSYVGERGSELHLTGVPLQKIDVSAAVARDQGVLLPAAVVVLGLTLAIFFRHLSGVAVPLAVAGLTVVWTVGLYAATGHELNAITSLLPPVLLVVALASTVHVYDAWLRGDDGAGATARALAAARAVFLPALLCAVTTAQGFASLSFGGLPAVRQFGLFAAFGTLAALVLATVVAPCVLSFVRPPRRFASDSHPAMRRLLDMTATLATGRPVAVLLVFAGLTTAFAAGIPLLRVDTDLVRFLGEQAPLRRDTEWIDANLGGTAPIEFLVRRRDDSAFERAADFARLEQLEKDMLARDQVAGVTSLLALLRQVQRAETGSVVLALPDSDESMRMAVDLLDESGHPLVRRLASPGMKELRLTVRLRGGGSAAASPLVAAIRADAARLLGPGIEMLPTGSMWEVVRDSDELVRRQVRSFGLAIVLVVAAIGLLLRSPVFTVVAMIPNVVPILWIGGLMGWCGIELSTGTAMIASAVLGLVVDDTIHYLVRYRRELAAAGAKPSGEAAATWPAVDLAAASRAGRTVAVSPAGNAVATSPAGKAAATSPHDRMPTASRDRAVVAVFATSRSVGAPVTVSALALVLGFWVGALGSFVPTVWFSLLTGLAMITGVICDLLVLPAALVLLDRSSRFRT